MKWWRIYILSIVFVISAASNTKSAEAAASPTQSPEPSALLTIHSPIQEDLTVREPPPPKKRTLWQKMQSPKFMKTSQVISTHGGALLVLIQLGWYLRNFQIPGGHL